VKRQGISRARRLRRQSTDAETQFWSRVRDRQLNGAKFRRQWPIDLFVIDFVCLESKLIVEIDGGQHDQKKEIDDARTKSPEGFGYKVIRFWNNDVLGDIASVLEVVANELDLQTPPHRLATLGTLSPGGEG